MVREFAGWIVFKNHKKMKNKQKLKLWTIILDDIINREDRDEILSSYSMFWSCYDDHPILNILTSVFKPVFEPKTKQR